ncbi:SDR family NAD(P)-dependent oxidoreductase [Deinococcus antarcticus]|uniref:SDR family NAD(P)-dependent oxidoreductase n=1 Tax=Deinococcus antarcticus TaxID=1298767 RepID=A0ABV8A3P5_9DEIO
MTRPFTPTALSGQVIAVTGADHGYGRLVSQALARSGASVVMIGGNAETLAAAASALEQYGGEIIPLKADVSVPLDFISAQERILEIFGGLHGVVHLADRRASTTFTLLTENEWMELFNCNVKSTVGIAQIIARRLPGTWLTVIGPHLDEVGLQVFPQRGAIQGLVQQAHTNDLRVNLILPGRASSGEEALDAPVADAVLALATTWLQNLRGNVMEIPLAPAPKVRLPDLQYL